MNAIVASPQSKFAEVNALRERLRTLRTGQTELVSMVGKPIMRRAFFPGGNGLVLGEDATQFPKGQRLILGSNFGAGEKFCTANGELFCQDETNNAGTWSGLRRLFSQQELEASFFTNAWPFLHVGTSNNPSEKEKKRWLKDPVLQSCLNFFRFSLTQIEPSMIVTLGTAPAAFLGYAFPAKLSAWQGNAWKEIDRVPFSFVGFGSVEIVCVAITHPSMSNVHSRRPELRDERKLIQAAWNERKSINVPLV